MKLHAIVSDLETARLAVEGGATVVQWRLKDVPRVDVVERGRATRSLCARYGVPFVVNDDVEAALMLGADGVHLGRGDEGAERARDSGLMLGLSASTLDEALAAAARATTSASARSGRRRRRRTPIHRSGCRVCRRSAAPCPRR